MAKIETWHRRQAIVLASQLPEDTTDAKMVLEAVQELVETFLVREPAAPLPANVVSLRDIPCA